METSAEDLLMVGMYFRISYFDELASSHVSDSFVSEAFILLYS